MTIHETAALTMTGRTLIALCCLALAVQRSSAALAIKRPALDCANPVVTEINSVNYFPPNSNAQIRSITPVVSDALSTTVSIVATCRLLCGLSLL